MSFGTKTEDIESVIYLCRALYRRLRDAGADYVEVSSEVRGLHTVLKHLKYEVEASDSLIHNKGSTWNRQLGPIVEDCDDTLQGLEDLLKNDHGNTSPQGQCRGGSLDTVGMIRVKLLSHKATLTKFLDGVQLDHSASVPEVLDNQDGHLDPILDKVDVIAARIQRENEGGGMTKQGDDKEVWKQFRKELIAEGFSSEILEQHRDVLRAYIREIDQKGLLDKVPPSSDRAPIAEERWLGPVKATGSVEKPPSFSSLDLTTEDTSAKAMMFEEENMKFPQSMKLELRRPEPRRGSDESKQIVPTIPRRRRLSSNSNRMQQVPKLIISEEKDVQYLDTDNSSDASSYRNSRQLSTAKALPLGEVIRTSDLIVYIQPSLLSHSPSSFRSTQSYFNDDSNSTKTLPYHPKKQVEFGTSPSQAGGIPIPQANPRSSHSSFNTAPSSRPRLAPDEHGNEIPSNAKWTKINRRLVSPEVLDQDHRRYEARPEFVAVLGVFSRSEIESLAERTRILRDARFRRSLPVQAPPQAPPRRPIPVPVSTPSRPHLSRHRSWRVTPSTSSSDTDSKSDSEEYDRRHRHGHHGHERRREGKDNRQYKGSNVGVLVSGYPNPFGQPVPLPSPVKSPGREDLHSHMSRNSEDSGSCRDRERARHGDRDRERDGSRRRHGASHTSRDKERERHGERLTPNQKSSRWKENLTAAGIGGAAVSLLNVLSEAAEGL